MDDIRATHLKRIEGTKEIFVPITRDEETGKTVAADLPPLYTGHYYKRRGYNYQKTDANFQISTNEAQINLGKSKLFLTRENENFLETRGNLNINLGAPGARKDFNFNGASSTIFLYSGNEEEETSQSEEEEKIYKPYYEQKIDHGSGINITTDQPYLYTSTNANYSIDLKNIKIFANENNLTLFNKAKDKEDNYINEIKLSGEEGT